MNERFKFRIEVVKNNEFDGFVYLKLGEKLPELHGGHYGVAEQCTGLKDKNGKLIYEGDIVGGSNGSINGCEWMFKSEVKWSDEEHLWLVPQFDANENWSHYYEIIGNIHENPELLEQKQK